MKEIVLTQGQVAIVDDDMYEELNRFKWYAQKDKNTFYARRMKPAVNGKRSIIHLHREIIGVPPSGLVTDHRDGNGLNNQRYNLRHVTNRQNSQNLRNIKKTSKYTGIYWNKRDKKWLAQIKINEKMKFLGYFTIEAEAFEAYKQAVEKLGEKVIAGTV